MPLIICSECNKEISDSADRCPQCGAKTPLLLKRESSKATRKLTILIVIGIVFAVFIGRVLYVKKQERDWIESGGAAAAQEALESIQDSVRQMENVRRRECESSGGRWSHAQLECRQ